VSDLQDEWEKENDRARNEVTRDEAEIVIELDIAAPRPMVWETKDRESLERMGAEFQKTITKLRPCRR
jgi:hypothetical protein